MMKMYLQISQGVWLSVNNNRFYYQDILSLRGGEHIVKNGMQLLHYNQIQRWKIMISSLAFLVSRYLISHMKNNLFTP